MELNRWWSLAEGRWMIEMGNHKWIGGTGRGEEARLIELEKKWGCSIADGDQMLMVGPEY
jgi:hypothetical protein